jgi:hypothetical protein
LSIAILFTYELTGNDTKCLSLKIWTPHSDFTATTHAFTLPVIASAIGRNNIHFPCWTKTNAILLTIAVWLSAFLFASLARLPFCDLLAHYFSSLVPASPYKINDY